MKLTSNQIKILSRVINIAHNLGQSHEQRIEILEVIHEADKVINKIWEYLVIEEGNDDVIRVGDKVNLYGKEFYVTYIDDEEHFSFPYKLSVYKEDIGLNCADLCIKYGVESSEWDLSDFDSLTKVKIK